ncbi:hypothetical protein PG995_007355 [Apiospora arundinis]
MPGHDAVARPGFTSNPMLWGWKAAEV